MKQTAKETDLTGAERKNGENKCAKRWMMTDGAAGVIVTGFFSLSEFCFLERMRQEDRQFDRQPESNIKKKRGKKRVRNESN